jgi:hypothetical protein
MHGAVTEAGVVKVISCLCVFCEQFCYYICLLQKEYVYPGPTVWGRPSVRGERGEAENGAGR